MTIQDMDICLNVTAGPAVTMKKVGAWLWLDYRLGKVYKHTAYVQRICIDFIQLRVEN